MARAGDRSDGELRPLPVLPSRLHLVESRFVTLKGATRRTLTFPELARTDDPSRQTEQLVVTVDAQLFYGVLQALPYLVNYPYECTEQTLNRFVSTGIVSSLFGRYPAVAKMAAELAKRDTRLEHVGSRRPEPPDGARGDALARGGEGRQGEAGGPRQGPRSADRQGHARGGAGQARARRRRRSARFPWWPGGPPSPYMTLYILYGISKAREFGVDVPKDMVQKALAYLHRHYRDEWVRDSMKCDCGWEFVTFLNYVLTSYPDDSLDGRGLHRRPSARRCSTSRSATGSSTRRTSRATSRSRCSARGRPADARLVWDSVMDSAKTDADTGTFWAPEDRAWLWYNDTIETHAFALRTLAELAPRDPRRDGLVQWLFLNKKLNHWKSTRGTAEVIYALVHYLKQEGQLGVREDATVEVGHGDAIVRLRARRVHGQGDQVVIPGRAGRRRSGPRRSSSRRPRRGCSSRRPPGTSRPSGCPTRGRATSSRCRGATSGARAGPGRGRSCRSPRARSWPGRRGRGAALAAREARGRVRAPARSARRGLRAGHPRLRVQVGPGLGLYEEMRDSGDNFFFEWLPAGEYTFRYRLRAATAGRFRVGPAEVQSMYAPEFAARSAGAVLQVALAPQSEGRMSTTPSDARQSGCCAARFHPAALAALAVGIGAACATMSSTMVSARAESPLTPARTWSAAACRRAR